MSEKKLSVIVSRYNPETDKEPHAETYRIPYRPGMFVLDALIYIHENLDGSLAFQYCCRSRRCGTCAVQVDGVPSLACKKKIEKDVTIRPLEGFPIVKDLVVDLSVVSRIASKIKPFLHPGKPSNELEMLPADSVQNYIELIKCINCYICLSDCPVASNNFAGPEVLLQLARRTYDPRDGGDRQKEALSLGVYDCTTCSACKIVCPKECDPLNAIINLRGQVVEKGRIPPTIRDALESTFKNGNPWSRIGSKRSEWRQGLNVNHVSRSTEVLYYVGCTSAYDPRVQAVPKSLVKCFERAGVNFGILEEEEKCCGSEVYGIGERGLFDFLISENMKVFSEYHVKQLVTNCPHGYDAFKNRYHPETFQIKHHTQLLAELIETGKLTPSKEVNRKVIYHDPCFLGKQNGIYDEPRKIIESIQGVSALEFGKSRGRSFCCGGGGGRMWIDAPERPSEIRIKDAVSAGAEILITACPFCLLSFEDAIKTAGLEGTIRIMDIAELLLEAI